MTIEQTNTQRAAEPALGGAIACFATAIIWSGNIIVTKTAVGSISPESIAFYRWSIALILLVPFVGTAAWRNRGLAIRHWKQLLILGGLGMVVYQSLAYKAAETTSATNMGIMLAMVPLLSTLLSCLFGSEPLRAQSAIGGLTSFAGLVFLTSQGDPLALLAQGFHSGDGLMLLAVLASALYGVLVRRWCLPISLWQQLFWQIFFATGMLFPFWLLGTPSPITMENLPLVLYAAIPASLFAPLLWMVGINHLGASRSALFVNLVPILVVLMAWALLGEGLESYQLIGGGCAVVGVLIGILR